MTSSAARWQPTSKESSTRSEKSAGAPTTAVMTGNLTNAVLSLLDSGWRRQPPGATAARRLGDSLHALIGFFGGCVVAAVAVSLFGDFAWLLPAGAACVAPVLR